jgi:hypothetical protein
MRRPCVPPVVSQSPSRYGATSQPVGILSEEAAVDAAQKQSKARKPRAPRKRKPKAGQAPELAAIPMEQPPVIPASVAQHPFSRRSRQGLVRQLRLPWQRLR